MLSEKEYFQNVSQLDKLKGYKRCVQNYIRFFFMYRRRYKNYIKIINDVRGEKYPIKATLNNGDTRIFRTYDEIYADLMALAYDDEKDIVYVDGLKFYGGKSDGDVANIFVKNEYGGLDVRGKVVIDIGASIGDSAIYFVKRGAKKVVAIEPNQETCKLARKNVELNGYSEVIELVRTGISSVSRQNEEPTTMTLSDVIEKYAPNADILKIDCEGCEYEIVLLSPYETISQFSHIQIEYHYGYRNLELRLRQCGFRVRVDGPVFFRPFNKISNVCCYYNSCGGSMRIDKLFVGMILAEKRSMFDSGE
jgi:hypothetical protein